MSPVRIVDQREIQRRGSVCARFPVSCLIRQLLEEAGVLKPSQQLKVLDLSFGEGRFWVAIPEAQVIAFDIQKLEWKVIPKQFFRHSCHNWKKLVADQEFDLVVADPPFSPYRRGWQKRNHYRANNAVTLILYEARKAALHFGAPMLVHFFAKLVFYGFEVTAEAWYSGSYNLSRVKFPTWFGVLKPT